MIRLLAAPSVVLKAMLALWDAKAKHFGVPLYKLLGPFTETVPIYGSGGWTSFDERELVNEQMGYVERGIPRVKMKVAKDFGQAEAEDLRRLRAVRKAVGDDVDIAVDAHGRLSPANAIRVAAALEQFDLLFFDAWRPCELHRVPHEVPPTHRLV